MPDAAVTVMVYVPGGVPGDPPEELPPPQEVSVMLMDRRRSNEATFARKPRRERCDQAMKPISTAKDTSVNYDGIKKRFRVGRN